MNNRGDHQNGLKYCLCERCVNTQPAPCPASWDYAPPPASASVLQDPQGMDYAERHWHRARTMDHKDVPSFDGEPGSVKDYLKRVELFELVDGGDPSTKAVRLLSALKGPAWSQAMDTLEPSVLNCPEGMLVFKSFIRTVFAKYEVLEEAEILDEFLEKCRRRGNEEHRAFANRFKALLVKMKRINVQIPETLAGYIYWKNGARLSEVQRSQVLTSCFNKFRLDAMIEACCIQYPSVAQHGGAGPHGAHVADCPDLLESESEVSSDNTDGAASGGVPQEVEHAVHVATQGYQNDKKKLSEARNARGFFRKRRAGNKPHGANMAIPDFAESQHPKVIKMKQANPCHYCSRTGHW